MKVVETWTRNTPSSVSGYSITVQITYSSFNLNEIEEVEKTLPQGTIVMDTDKPQRLVWPVPPERFRDKTTDT